MSRCFLVVDGPLKEKMYAETARVKEAATAFLAFAKRYGVTSGMQCGSKIESIERLPDADGTYNAKGAILPGWRSTSGNKQMYPDLKTKEGKAIAAELATFVVDTSAEFTRMLHKFVADLHPDNTKLLGVNPQTCYMFYEGGSCYVGSAKYAIMGDNVLMWMGGDTLVIDPLGDHGLTEIFEWQAQQLVKEHNAKIKEAKNES